MTTATEAATSFLSPATGLLTRQVDPRTNKEGYAFPLQTSAWLKMQVVVRHALSFPLTAKDFTNTYGTFSDEGAVTDALKVLGKIRTTAIKYGDPQTLISDIQKFQDATEPPASIYGHAVWLAAQTQTTAQQIGTYLNTGITDIGSAPDAKTRIQELTELLAGKGGVNDLAMGLRSRIESFTGDVSKFYVELNAELTGRTNSLAIYLKQSSNVLTDAENAVKNDLKVIHQLQSNIDKLNSEYIGFTVAASVSPLFLLVPFFGPFLAVADAATFAALAIEVKKDLEKAQAGLKKERKEEQQKAALVAQLKSFNTSAQTVEGDGKSFLSALSKMTGGWEDFVNQINARLKTLTVQDVEDWNAFLAKINFQTSLKQWHLVASKAEEFFTNGFVTFDQSSNS